MTATNLKLQHVLRDISSLVVNELHLYKNQLLNCLANKNGSVNQLPILWRTLEAWIEFKGIN